MTDHDHEAHIDRLQKEVERLRGALREIIDAHTWNGLCPSHAEIARKALRRELGNE